MIRDFFIFSKSFVQNPKIVGSVIPSSKKLAKELISVIEDSDKPQVIVELGVGTGVVTKEIIRELSSQNKSNDFFFAVELNKSLYENCLNQIPSINIVNGDASELKSYLKHYNVAPANIVISSIPWANLNPCHQQVLLKSIIQGMAPDATFTTFGYFGAHILPAGKSFLKLLKQHFSKVEVSEVIWENIPPALIYRCRL